MEFIILITELLMKNIAQFGTVTGVFILGMIVIYSLKKQNEDRVHSDKRFDQVLSSQDDMRKEYRESIYQVNKAFEEEMRITNQTLEEIQKQQVENNLMTLRSIITNSSLPREYRLTNYDHYIKQGGNSWLVEYVKKELLNDTSEE